MLIQEFDPDKLPPNLKVKIINSSELNQSEKDLLAGYQGSARYKRVCEYYLSRKALAELLQEYGESYPIDLDNLSSGIIMPEYLNASLTHSGDLAAVILAEKKHYTNLGIDLEKKKLVSNKIIERICTQAEIDFIIDNELKEEALLYFSAKEAIYKAYSHLIQQFSYQRIEVSYNPKTDSFSGKIQELEQEIPIFIHSYQDYLLSYTLQSVE